MGRVSDRLKREGITWPQFFFQFVIVLLGVYLAILSERRAEENNLREDAEVILGNLLTELEQDEAELERIIQAQSSRLAAARRLGDVLARAAASDAPEVDSLVEYHIATNPTAFMRESAYSAMVTGGYFRTLIRTDLPVKLANLYERTYTRIGLTGELQDFEVFERFIPVMLNHFNMGESSFIEPGREANIQLRNAALRLVRTVNWYIGFLEETLNEVRAVKAEVSQYFSTG